MALTDLQLNQLSGQNAGRNPSFTSGEPYAGGGNNPGLVAAPGSLTDGVDVSSAQLAAVAVELRTRPDRNAIRIRLTYAAGSQTYAFSIGSDAYSITYSATSELDAAQAMVSHVNEEFTGGAPNVASLAATGTDIVLYRLDGAALAQPSSLTRVTGVDRDTDAVSITLWGLPQGLETWCVVGQLEGFDLTSSWTDLVRVSPLSRLCVQVTGVDRTGTCPERVVVHIGPCQAEAS
jgi:hypothetical protein